MKPSKFLLNPNAAPFTPHSSDHEEAVKDQLFDPVSLPTLEKLLISDEDDSRRIHQIHGPKDHASQSEIMGFEKQDMDDNFKFAEEYLSSFFPNVSLESLHEVYCLCGDDLTEAVNMLQQLEGYGDHSCSLPNAQDDKRTASSTSPEDTSIGASESSGYSEPAPDREPVQHSYSANTDSI